MAAELVGRLAAEITGPMTDALARVSSLAREGQIDREGLQALVKDIAQTRQAGLLGQRIARLVSGVRRQPAEAIDLAELVRLVTHELGMADPGEMSADAQARRLRVAGDPALLHALIEATAHRATDRARAPLKWTVRQDPWPPQAVLSCSFDRDEAGPAPDDPDAIEAAEAAEAERAQDASLDGLMMRYAAHAAGATVELVRNGERQRVDLRFSRLVNDSLEGASAIELDARGNSASQLAGCQLLVLGQQRTLCQHVRQALRGREVFVDYVPSVEMASRYCDEGLPQALLFESHFNGSALRQLCARLSATSPAVALLEIAPDRHPVERGDTVVRLGHDLIDEQLEALVWLQLQQTASATSGGAGADSAGASTPPTEAS